MRVLKAATYSLFLVTLGPASVNAQAPSSTRIEARSPLSEIAHEISNWFTRASGTDGSRQQRGSLPARLLTPLPRPRPTELTSVPVTPNPEPLKPTAAPVPSNNESSELTTGSVPPIREQSEPTAAPVSANDGSSELTATPNVPKKKAPAPVLIND